jgi:hypothetical protein
MTGMPNCHLPTGTATLMAVKETGVPTEQDAQQFGIAVLYMNTRYGICNR